MENVEMDAALFEIGPQPLLRALRFGKGFHRRAKATVLASLTSYPAKARTAFSFSRVRSNHAERHYGGRASSNTLREPSTSLAAIELVEDVSRRNVPADLLVELALDKRKLVGVDGLCLGSGHAVRRTLVGFQDAITPSGLTFAVSLSRFRSTRTQGFESRTTGACAPRQR
jgi:hypothetical protein